MAPKRAREELGGHRGDDGAAGAEAEAEEDRVGVERRHVRPHLEPEQAERSHRGAAVGDRGRGGAPDPIGRDAEPDPAHDREQPGEPEDRGDEQPREAVVHREGHLVRDDREDRQRRAEIREEERPERPRPQRVADFRAPRSSPRPGRARRFDPAPPRPASCTPSQIEGEEHGERAQAQDEIGGAPAKAGDQPLGERAHRQHARSHARERHAHRAAPPLGVPARDQRARSGPSSPRTRRPRPVPRRPGTATTASRSGSTARTRRRAARRRRA